MGRRMPLAGRLNGAWPGSEGWCCVRLCLPFFILFCGLIPRADGAVVRVILTLGWMEEAVWFGGETTDGEEVSSGPPGLVRRPLLPRRARAMDDDDNVRVLSPDLGVSRAGAFVLSGMPKRRE